MFKTLPASIKAVDNSDAGDGIIEALVATYDVDSIGDRIVPGAFAKSLDEWASRAEPIPFIWSHMHDDLDAYLGDVLEAKEVDDGLYVKAQLDMDDERARKAFRLIKGGRVRNYSFAYEVIDAGPDEDGDGETALRELRLFEVGPTLIGMNQNTRTLAAKRGDMTQLKRGRVLSAANETSLRDAYDAIGAVLAQLDSDDSSSSDEPDDDDEKSTQQGESAQPAEPVKADERASAKADEPMPFGPADEDLLLIIQIADKEGIAS